MSGKIDPHSPLTSVASEIEERRCDLIDRHRHLRDKVATMERSIPALMTCNLWRMISDGRDQPDLPYRIVRQIVEKLSPDPVDKLLTELRGTVDELRLETAQLHDKIIDTDVKMEETTMELESLELANRETEEKLVGLRNRVQSRGTPSLHSIHSEDLICLKKIRQLAEEELTLKSCITELEDKEATYRRQMKQFLPCEQFQRYNEKVGGCVRSCTEGRGGELGPARKPDATKRCAFKSVNKQKTCCSCPTTSNEQTSTRSFHLPHLYENLCPSLSRYIPLDNRGAPKQYKVRSCRAFCKAFQRVAPAAAFEPCTTNDRRESALNTVPKTDVRRSPKHLAHFSTPCESGKTCDTCDSFISCEQIDDCRCGCEESSASLCNCSIPSLIPTTRAASMTSEMLRSKLATNDGASDEEFCECCTCGEDIKELT